MLNHIGYSQLDLVTVRSLSQTKAVSLLSRASRGIQIDGH